jgi:uncharacterized membrane protein YbhN (UPF0104 family)
LKKKIQIIAGLLLGAFLVWFLFRETDWAKVYELVLASDWRWLVAAFAAVMVSFGTRSQRWAYIVRAAKPVPFRTLFNATQIGFLGNYTLPARAGELIRALVLSRRERIPFTKCVAFVALDRVTDLFGLLAVMVVTIVAFRPEHAVVLPPGMELPDWARPLLEPDKLRVAAEVTGGVIALIVGALVVLYLNQPLALRVCGGIVGLVSKRLAARANEMLSHFAEGLHVFRSARDIALALLWSSFTWGLALVCFEAVFAAFHLDAPWYASSMVLAVMSVAISLPGAPGFIGQYHVGIMLPLFIMLPGLSLETASAVAILAHLINLAGVVIAGVYSLHSEHIGLLELQHESEEAAEHTQDPA